MTNSDILKTNLLDIIFENRNKDYGAYELRNNYGVRMMKALSAGLLLTGAIVLIASNSGSEKKTTNPYVDIKEGVVLKTIELPKVKIVEPEKPKETVVAKQKPAPKIATVKYTAPVIKKDIEVKEPMATVDDMKEKEIGTQNIEGKPSDQTVVVNKDPVKEPGEGTVAGPTQPAESEFVAIHRDPEFPGGPEALKQFLARNLNTPEDLDEGQRKVVRVKFQVGKDGVVNTFEIVTSGGGEFDKEVLRVVKKMPRWTPAIQNGINVPVSYLLPVTFIGVEQ